ncbi:MAG: phytanoyl-CoA dioxygenase family protein [Verrucomicrobia bacterium]|nr:phytanoyl-CoA dioxygenase family protein [Verrucomicrobiota bacterium]MDA1086357.1 phytanoyl-CoA dioxygenase family protein [Verrucomicrobiota bacterium]
MNQISDKDIDQFHELGYFVTGVVFTDDELRPMREEFDRVYAEHVAAAEARGDAAEADRLRGQRAYGQFHTHSDVAAAFARKPVYMEACRKLIGGDADLYYNQAAVKPPAGHSKTFAWHQDSGYQRTEPLTYITCWTAIGDSDLDNGCIWIIPGSPSWGLLEHLPEEETAESYGGLTAQFSDDSGQVPVEMKAGQVAIFSSLMLHKSGPNLSRDRARYGYVPQYHVPNAIAADSGKPWGDLVPVLRDGNRV